MAHEKDTQQYSINDFCFKLRVRKSELAKLVSASKQQISIWSHADSGVFIEHNEKNKEIKIKREARELRSAKFTVPVTV